MPTRPRRVAPSKTTHSAKYSVSNLERVTPDVIGAVPSIIALFHQRCRARNIPSLFILTQLSLTSGIGGLGEGEETADVDNGV